MLSLRALAAGFAALSIMLSVQAQPASAALTIRFDARSSATFTPADRNSRTSVLVTGLNPFRGETVTKTVNSAPAVQGQNANNSSQTGPSSTVRVASVGALADCAGTDQFTSLKCLRAQLTEYMLAFRPLRTALAVTHSIDGVLNPVDAALRAANAQKPGDAGGYASAVDQGVLNTARSQLTLLAASPQVVKDFVAARDRIKATPTDTSSVDADVDDLKATVLGNADWQTLASAASEALKDSDSRPLAYEDTELCNTMLAARTTRYAVMRGTKEVAALTVHCRSEWYGGGIYVFSRLDSTTYSVGQSGFLAAPAPAPVQNVIVTNNNVNIRRFTQPVGHFCPASLSWERLELCGSIAPAIQTGNAAYGGGDGVLVGATILTLNRALGLSFGGHYGQVNQLQPGYANNSVLLPGTSIDQVLTHPYKMGFYYGIVFSAPTQ